MKMQWGFQLLFLIITSSYHRLICEAVHQIVQTPLMYRSTGCTVDRMDSVLFIGVRGVVRRLNDRYRVLCRDMSINKMLDEWRNYESDRSLSSSPRPSGTRKSCRSRVLKLHANFSTTSNDVSTGDVDVIGRLPSSASRHQLFVNQRNANSYFQSNPFWIYNLMEPLFEFEKMLEEEACASTSSTYSNFVYPTFTIHVSAEGGGLSSQADASSVAIARTLVKCYPSIRQRLKSVGLLTIDSRVVERKKCGLKKARKAPQYSKR